jgi:hypothetical protein
VGQVGEGINYMDVISDRRSSFLETTCPTMINRILAILSRFREQKIYCIHIRALAK